MDPVFPRARLWLSLVWLFMVPALAEAQQTLTSATVSGTVYDPTEAIVVGAAITIRNRDTNQTSTPCLTDVAAIACRACPSASIS